MLALLRTPFEAASHGLSLKEPVHSVRLYGGPGARQVSHRTLMVMEPVKVLLMAPREVRRAVQGKIEIVDVNSHPTEAPGGMRRSSLFFVVFVVFVFVPALCLVRCAPCVCVFFFCSHLNSTNQLNRELGCGGCCEVAEPEGRARAGRMNRGRGRGRRLALAFRFLSSCLLQCPPFPPRPRHRYLLVKKAQRTNGRNAQRNEQRTIAEDVSETSALPVPWWRQASVSVSPVCLIPFARSSLLASCLRPEDERKSRD